MRAFAAHDEAVLRPGVEVDRFGELGDFGALATAAAGLDSRFPVLFLHEQQGVADAVVDVEAEAAADVAVSAFLGELVARPGRVGPGQNRPGSPGGNVAGTPREPRTSRSTLSLTSPFEGRRADSVTNAGRSTR